MNPHNLSQRQPSLVLILVLAVFFAVCVVGAASGTGQSDQKEEREFKDEIPSHLPIKVKVKNAEKAKDLKNDDWMRDIEIEVKNTGTKPIYYLRISLFFMDVDFTPDRQYGFPFVYGRHELMDFAEPVTPEDVPIMPGKVHVFRISESRVNGWKHRKTRENKPHPKKIGFTFHVLNFGDGTGFLGTSGGPFPGKKSSVEGNKATTTTAIGWRSRSPDASFLSSFFLPADFLPVIFIRQNRAVRFQPRLPLRHAAQAHPARN